MSDLFRLPSVVLHFTLLGIQHGKGTSPTAAVIQNLASRAGLPEDAGEGLSMRICCLEPLCIQMYRQKYDDMSVLVSITPTIADLEPQFPQSNCRKGGYPDLFEETHIPLMVFSSLGPSIGAKDGTLTQLFAFFIERCRAMVGYSVLCYGIAMDLLPRKQREHPSIPAGCENRMFP